MSKGDELRAAAGALSSAADLLRESANTLDTLNGRISYLEELTTKLNTQLNKEKEFKQKLVSTIQEYIN